MNWDWAEDMISSPSASLRELGGHVISVGASRGSEDTYPALEEWGSAYMRSPLSRKDWVSCSANPCTPRLASWLGLMRVNNDAFLLSFLLALKTKDAHRFQTLSCDFRIPGSACHRSELYKKFGRRYSKEASTYKAHLCQIWSTVLH